MTTQTLQLKFCFPPLYGVYDTGEGVIYIFGDQDDQVEEVLSHEFLHWVLQKIDGKQTSLALDNIPPELLTIQPY